MYAADKKTEVRVGLPCDYKDNRPTMACRVNTQDDYDRLMSKEGVYYIKAEVTSTLGQYSEAWKQIVVDKTLPAISAQAPTVIEQPTSSTVFASTIDYGVSGRGSMRMKVYDSLTGKEVMVGSMPCDWNTASCKITIGIEMLKPARNYYITTIAVDAAGNSNEVRTHEIKMQPSAPTIVSAVSDKGADVKNSYTNSYDITLNWSPVPEVVGYEYGYWNEIEGNAWKESSYYPVVLGAQSLSQSGAFTEGEGKHYLAVRSIAANGTKSVWSKVSVTYDRSDPVVKFLPRSTPQTNLMVDADVTDVNLTKVAFTVRTPDNTEINVVYSENASNPLSLRDYDLCANDRLKACTDNKLKDGVYTVRAATYDKAGNRNISTSSTIVVDRTAPQISIVLPEDKAILDGSVDIVGNTTDANPSSSKLTVLNAQGEVVISSDDTTGKTQQKLSWDTLKVPDGKYVIKFDATDSAGNTASTVIDVTVANSQNNVVGGLINNPVAPTAPARSVGGQQGSQSRTAQPTPRYVALGGDTTPVDETITTQETSSPTSVLGQSTTNNGVMSAFNSEDILGTKSCSTILGLCWYWWIPITIAAIATIWFLAYLSQRREEESFGSF